MAMNPALFWFGVWRQAAELWLRLPAVPRDDVCVLGARRELGAPTSAPASRRDQPHRSRIACCRPAGGRRGTFPSMDRDYWTKALREAERELEDATTRSAVNAAAKKLMQAKAELKALEDMPAERPKLVGKRLPSPARIRQ
jgi:hypothetical protein